MQALEENRFDVLGAPVFAKGHLRKYADLVGVPIEDVLADYYSLNRAVGAPPVVGGRANASGISTWARGFSACRSLPCWRRRLLVAGPGARARR